MIEKAMERVGVYYYMLPEYSQARKVMWDAIDKNWFRMLDHVPKELLESKNEQQMKLTLINGSIIQLVGSDDYDSIMGSNPVGIVFSEYSLQDPQVRGYFRPILLENGGRAIFNYTPRWRNHWRVLLQTALQRLWTRFISIQKATETLDNDWNRILTDDQLEEEKLEYILNDDEDKYMQEYMCSFTANVKGSYYGAIIDAMEKQGRITNVPYEEDLETDTVRDIGISDAAAVWLFQLTGKEVRIVDYIEKTNVGLNMSVSELRKKKKEFTIVFNKHYLPHDARVREMTTGQSRVEYLESIGLRNVEITPNIPLMDWIEAARRVLKYCWIDKVRCARLIECLKEYHKEYDEKNKIYKDTPKHNRASHAADMIRYFAVNYLNMIEDMNNEDPSSIVTDYSKQL